MFPYIGVTGFMTSAEVSYAIQTHREAWNNREPTHELMVGVLASDKTLRGEKNKWSRRYPPVEEISALFEDAPNTLNLIHYAGEKSLENLIRLNNLGGSNCDGFQLNGDWPDPAVLTKLLETVGDRRIVLQVGPTMLAKLNVSGADFLERLEPLADVITDVLIDASGGKGLPIDPATTSWPVSIVAENYPKLGIGIAGGLCAETVTPTLGQMLRAKMSVDAEGRLRDEADGGGNLDLVKMSAYIKAVVSKCHA